MAETALPLPSLRRSLGAALAVGGALLLALLVWMSAVGGPVTESFRLADTEGVEGAMRVYRIDYVAWERHPLRIIDDARHGAVGTSSALFVNGESVEAGRASRTVMVDGDEPSYLHAGLQNFYFSLGPEPPEDPLMEARFQVRLEWPAAAGIGLAALLILVTGLGLLTGSGLVADTAVLILILLSAGALWLGIAGIRFDRPVPVEQARPIAPHGYLVRMEPPFAMVTPATDRLTPVIRGWLREDGRRIGPPTALGSEVRDPGRGAHVWARGGALYFSTPDNSDPRSNGRTYVLEQQAFLSPYIAASLGGAALLALLALILGGNGALAGLFRQPAPRLSAVVLPGAILISGAGYVGWLLWVDPLHLTAPPEQRDWFAGDEPHRIAGLVRSYPYRGVLIGTSVVQNIYMDHASSRLGMPVLNAAIAGSSPAEQVQLAERALSRPTTDLLLWEIHLTGFTQPPGSSRFAGFPSHLLDGNPLTDLEYLFSLQAWLDAHDAIAVRAAGTAGLLDPINKWGERLDFGPAVVAKSYCERRGRSAGVFRAENLRANLQHYVRPLAEAHGDVRFVLFIPPYSAMMHMAEGGAMTGMEGAAAVILDELGDLPNVSLFDFQGLPDVTGDASLFRDDMHARPEVTRRIIDGIASGERQVSPADLAAHAGELRRVFERAAPAFRAAVEPYCGG